MKTLLLALAILVSISVYSQDYNISRYEQKSDQLFICINSTVAPVYVEHFFTEGQRSCADSIKITIEKLVAELEIKADKYIVPEPLISKVDEAKAIKLSSINIAIFKAEKILESEKVIETEEIIKDIIK